MFKELVQVVDRLLFGGKDQGGLGLDPRSNPTVGGFLTMQLRERGKVVPGSRREGHNIWTLTGREFIVETISLASLAPTRQKNRDDAVLYFGLGSGVQPEVAEVSRLLNPVEYLPGEFLAQAQVPVDFPSSASGSARTAVRLVREYATHEISMGAPVTLTEFGCFTDGDPDNNNVPGRPTGFGTASVQAPVGYKTIEPLTKTTARTLEAIYEIRVI